MVAAAEAEAVVVGHEVAAVHTAMLLLLCTDAEADMAHRLTCLAAGMYTHDISYDANANASIDTEAATVDVDAATIRIEPSCFKRHTLRSLLAHLS